MQQIVEKSCPIKLSFGMESSSSLWNIVFEGFDQDVVLISRFEGKDLEAINLLFRFGDILRNNYPDCLVVTGKRGLSIKKQFPRNDVFQISEWSELMNNIREEIVLLLAE